MVDVSKGRRDSVSKDFRDVSTRDSLNEDKPSFESESWGGSAEIAYQSLSSWVLTRLRMQDLCLMVH